MPGRARRRRSMVACGAVDEHGLCAEILPEVGPYQRQDQELSDDYPVGAPMMTGSRAATRLRTLTAETLAEVTGQDRRTDPVLESGGGPAGNARLTAWTGLVLLLLFGAELVTLLGVRQMITWHLAIGALLIPPALVKTASTGWRIARYYTGDRPYRDAGPPSLVLRVLGPLVVITTLALLGSGLALVFTGPSGARTPLFTVFGQPVDTITVHKATFVAWGAVTGLHVLGRLILALRLTVRPGAARLRVPGGFRRAAALIVTGAVAAPLRSSWWTRVMIGVRSRHSGSTAPATIAIRNDDSHTGAAVVRTLAFVEGADAPEQRQRRRMRAETLASRVLGVLL